VTIHSEHPFQTPAADRDLARRFRGRLGGAVTLVTAGEGLARAGLTVSSLMVAHGDPAHVLALVDPDSSLAGSPTEVGWSALVDGVVEEVHLAEPVDPLVHRRGRYLPPR
jgi:hypothetical protein